MVGVESKAEDHGKTFIISHHYSLFGTCLLARLETTSDHTIKRAVTLAVDIFACGNQGVVGFLGTIIASIELRGKVRALSQASEIKIPQISWYFLAFLSANA